jgi:hypothetical protein
MKPSRAIIKNWENVIILPLDGSSLERKNQINRSEQLLQSNQLTNKT